MQQNSAFFGSCGAAPNIDVTLSLRAGRENPVAIAAGDIKGRGSAAPGIRGQRQIPK
ncbi:MAG: hypothetical protein R3C68_04750 [Myxococcota bacterium]